MQEHRWKLSTGPPADHLSRCKRLLLCCDLSPECLSHSLQIVTVPNLSRQASLALPEDAIMRLGVGYPWSHDSSLIAGQVHATGSPTGPESGLWVFSASSGEPCRIKYV